MNEHWIGNKVFGIKWYFDHGNGSTYFCLEPNQARLTQNRDLRWTLMI